MCQPLSILSKMPSSKGWPGATDATLDRRRAFTGWEPVPKALTAVSNGSERRNTPTPAAIRRTSGQTPRQRPILVVGALMMPISLASSDRPTAPLPILIQRKRSRTTLVVRPAKVIRLPVTINCGRDGGGYEVNRRDAGRRPRHVAQGAAPARVSSPTENIPRSAP